MRRVRFSWPLGGDLWHGLARPASLPRQQLPLVYWQNGYVDVLRPTAVLLKNSMWGDRVLPFILKDSIFELDYPENIPQIEEALRMIEHGNKGSPKLPDRHPV